MKYDVCKTSGYLYDHWCLITVFPITCHVKNECNNTNVTIQRYLLKRRTTSNDLKPPETTWNDLQQPTTSKKRPETTYNEQETTWSDLKRPTTSRAITTWNDLQRHEKTYSEQEIPGNDLQWARNDLKRPTTSKAQPRTTLTYLQRAKKDSKQPTTTRFWDYFTIWGNRFSSLTCFQPNIWLQSFKHCFTENHGENRVPNISILSCVFITGYKIYGILTLRTTLTLVN